MTTAESLIGWVEETVKKPGSKLVEAGRDSKFEISWQRFVFSEKIRLFLAPVEPLTPEDEILNKWLLELNLPPGFVNRRFHGGAGTHLGRRYYNDLELAILHSQETIPGTAEANWNLSVNSSDQGIVTRYAANPVDLKPTKLELERTTTVILYPNIRIAQAVADYHTAKNMTPGNLQDPLLARMTYTILKDWVRRIEEENTV